MKAIMHDAYHLM